MLRSIFPSSDREHNEFTHAVIPSLSFLLLLMELGVKYFRKKNATQIPFTILPHNICHVKDLTLFY